MEIRWINSLSAAHSLIIFIQLDKFDDFFAAHGLRCLLLYYQEADTPTTGESNSSS